MTAVCAAVVVSACDESFEPLAPSHLQFSVFGYLDAAADTQWIRVMPIRPLLVTSPSDSFSAVVTLEELGTGRIIEMRDSVFRFSSHHNPELGSEGAYVHNFWTTERIEPGATYRFTATRNGGPPAEGLVEVPDEFEVAFLLKTTTRPQDRDFLRVTGLKHVAFLTVTTEFWDRCGPGVSMSTFLPPGPDGEDHQIELFHPEIIPRQGCGEPIAANRDVSVVGSTAAWPAGAGHSPQDLVPAEASNLTNSLGFLGGILTRAVPYESCTFKASSVYCEVQYDSESASLTGFVEETFCGNGPIDSVLVRLEELDGEPDALRKIRTAITDLSGEFEIDGLEPGMRYDVLVRARMVIVPFVGLLDTHTRQTDTIVFVPGEHRNYNAALSYNINPCGFPVAGETP
ncbi:MAG: hypothetical protein WEF86_14390 [Gemmatimonadota bacterium]